MSSARRWRRPRRVDRRRPCVRRAVGRRRRADHGADPGPARRSRSRRAERHAGFADRCPVAELRSVSRRGLPSILGFSESALEWSRASLIDPAMAKLELTMTMSLGGDPARSDRAGSPGERATYNTRSAIQRPGRSRDTMGREPPSARTGRAVPITTVRADGRPHVTPLVAVWLDDAIHFATGPRAKGDQPPDESECDPEHRLQRLGKRSGRRGRGRAVRVTDDALLERLAEAWTRKWRPVALPGVRRRLSPRGRRRGVRVLGNSIKVLAFGKRALHPAPVPTLTTRPVSGAAVENA